MVTRLIHALLLGAIATAAFAQEASSFAQAIKLTDVEKIVLSDVTDKSPQLDETAFYMMLAKTAAIAGRTDHDFTLIDSPSPGQLLANPQRWRGWALRLGVTVYRVEKLQGRQLLSSSPHWPVGKAVWKLSGTAATDPNIPIVAFCVTPPLALGKADSTTTDATGLEIQTYKNGVAVEVVGISYKVWSHTNTQGHVQNYPIVIAWQIARATPDREVELPGPLVKTVAVGMALLIGYLFLKVYTRRLRKAAPRLQKPGGIESAGDESADASSQIDPLLKAAAEQYAKDTDADGESKDS